MKYAAKRLRRNSIGQAGASWLGLALLVSAVWLAGCSRAAAPTSRTGLQVTSSAFTDQGFLPTKYTCEGAGISPPLAWSRVPARAKSLVVTCQDPDAPSGTFTHWLLYDIPAAARGLKEGSIPSGAKQGRNDFGGIGFGAPCPPAGRAHHYIFTLYALDTLPSLPSGASKGAVFATLNVHILAQGQITGLYRRQST